MNKSLETAVIVTVVSAFVYVQGVGLGKFTDLAPSTVAATAASANSSASAIKTTYNAVTDELIEITAPARDLKSEV
jgi:hypothetical protein